MQCSLCFNYGSKRHFQIVFENPNKSVIRTRPVVRTARILFFIRDKNEILQEKKVLQDFTFSFIFFSVFQYSFFVLTKNDFFGIATELLFWLSLVSSTCNSSESVCGRMEHKTAPVRSPVALVPHLFFSLPRLAQHSC